MKPKLNFTIFSQVFIEGKCLLYKAAEYFSAKKKIVAPAKEGIFLPAIREAYYIRMVRKWRKAMVPLLCLVFFSMGYLYKASFGIFDSSVLVEQELPLKKPVLELAVATDFQGDDNENTPPSAMYKPENDNVKSEAQTIEIAELSAPETAGAAGKIGIYDDITGRRHDPDPDLLALTPSTRASLARIRRASTLESSLGSDDSPQSIIPEIAPAQTKPLEARRSFEVKREKPVAEIFNQLPKLPPEEMTAEKAEKAPKLAVQIKAAPTDVYKMLGEAHEALIAGQEETAITLYGQVLDRDPDNKTATFGLAVAYQKNQQTEQARDLYQRLLDQDPGNSKVLNNYLMVLGDEAPDEALMEFQKLAAASPRIPSIPAQMAMIELKRDNLGPAAQYMNRALQLDPSNIQYKYNLAIILDRMGHAAQAGILYSQLLEAAKGGQQLPETTTKIRDRLIFISRR